MNGDGHLDLAVANGGQVDATVLLGDGAGNFGPAGTYAAQASTISIAAGDFSGGGADVLVGNIFLGISLLRNDGTGQLREDGLLSQNSHPVAMLVADFNLDGKPDFAAGGGSDLTIFLHV